MNPQIVLPDWSRLNHANERSKRLRPFAPAGRPSNVPVSHPYPEDYGSKPNSVGWIGEASLAGKTDTQYGTILDPQQPLYLLADRDIEILLLWMPGGWNETKLQGLLLTEFNRSAAELPSLTWPNIIAMLASRNSQPDGDKKAKGQATEANAYGKTCQRQAADKLAAGSRGNDAYVQGEQDGSCPAA
jgi:hypothetical protein